MGELVGPLAFAFTFRRPMLSVLMSCYQFARVGGVRDVPAWGSAAKELDACRGLLLLARSSGDLVWGRRVIATDAFLTRMVVAAVAMDLDFAKGCGRRVERQRFRSPSSGSLAPVFVLGVS
eukprot:3668663-Pyramimonas_sp.AAC.1